MKTPILLASPTMHGDEMAYINEAFERNWVAPLGFNCDAFEQEMAQYLMTGDVPQQHALALVSGTSALHLAVKLAGVRAGDVVLCSDMTFAATVNPVVYEGAVPVFVDSERETWNMDPVALEKAFEKYPQAKVVILAHLYGSPAKMDEILDVCRRHNVVLIEDAAEALGADYKGRRCGTFGAYNILSFNGNKIITTSGGGMLVTENKEARDKALFWATQSRENAYWYEHKEIGYNYRLSNICAGIGRGQLLHLEDHVAAKKAIYERYREAFADLPVTMNPYVAESTPNFWLSCMLIDESSNVDPIAVLEALKEEQIESRPIWKPMHMQPVFADADFVTAGDEAVDEMIFAKGLCLPSDIKMTAEQQQRVIDAIKACF
ncbi:MAG: aminotransferase class I/II-fold pyridoxal phosphate-dependent enzyme [Clostridia bacterium]|nr:aminotransferase class I/II-fold pyridoxal phosphate-dependent enzyme [Clostridia bacterium]